MQVRDTIHVPVLAEEVLRWLDPRPGQTFIDGTLGGGGHARLLAERVGNAGRVIALDRDPAAIALAERQLAGLPVMVAQRDFCEAPEVLREIGVERVDGVLLDLGLSSDQLADQSRGFSFEGDGPLDLRFDAELGEPAWRLLAKLSEEKLADLIYEFGEERHSRRIAREIVARRRNDPVKSARDLAELVRRCAPKSKSPQKSQPRIHPATRTFQALRIAVNDELKSLEIALQRLPEVLAPSGRIAVISFHSLEDRRVKEAFRDDGRLEVLTRKPIRPSDAEVARNPRSRSAKLRVAQREDGSLREPKSRSRSERSTERPTKIVSGGQTGVDRGALDAAIELGIPHGGWCPAGRKAEDGPIPAHYNLRETASAAYHDRTERNVIDSDGTLILHRGELSGGTKLTRQFAVRHGRPFLVIDLAHSPPAGEVREWLAENCIATLNVAGPRESSAAGIRAETRRFLRAALG